MSKCFLLPNLAVNSASEVEFETVLKSSQVIPEEIEDKKQLKKWREHADTDYPFLSFYEGELSTLRVSEKSNPAVKCHALMFDFDSPMEAETAIKLIEKNAPSLYAPTYYSRSFSGGAHLLYLFQTPINLVNQKLAKALPQLFAVRAKVRKVLPGFDKGSLEQHMYYTKGTKWTKLNDPIKSSVLEEMMFEITSNTKIFERHEGAIALPFDVIKEEVQKRFPNKWKSKFAPSARGIAFWDPAAKDPTEALMHAEGMYRFTDGQYFVPWSDDRLFGASFVAEFQADRISGAVSNFYYDGKHYWRLTNDTDWRIESKEDVRLMLRVDGAAPFIYNRNAVVRYNGSDFLNVARVRPVEMADREVSWDDPMLQPVRLILDAWFGSVDDVQWKTMISWLSRLYRNAYEGQPQANQAMFVVGPPGVGKTLWSLFCGMLLGGSEDIGRFLLGRDDFNENMFYKGLCTVDDDGASVSTAQRKMFESKLKQFVANSELVIRKMQHAPMKMPYQGAVMITLNQDADSLSVAPDLNQSNREKTNMLYIDPNATVEFPVDEKTGRGVIMELLRRALPYFARFLYDYKIPEEVRGGPRFGVKEYIHPALENATSHQSYEHGLQEILEEFAENHYLSKTTPYWGTSTQILQELADMFDRKLLESLNQITLPKRLNLLIDKGCSWIQVKVKNKRRGYEISHPRPEEQE